MRYNEGEENWVLLPLILNRLEVNAISIQSSAAIRGNAGEVLRPRNSRKTWSIVEVKQGSAFCSMGQDEYLLSAGHILVISPPSNTAFGRQKPMNRFSWK